MYFSFFFHQLCPPHHGWMAQLWCLSRCRRMGSPPTPGPASHSQFLVLPPRAPQPQGSCSSPQGPSGGQAKSLQSPPRAHLLLFPRCRGHWPKDTQLTTSGARFTPRVRGPGRDAGEEDRTCGSLWRAGGSHQTGRSSDQHCPAARLRREGQESD